MRVRSLLRNYFILTAFTFSMAVLASVFLPSVDSKLYAADTSALSFKTGFSFPAGNPDPQLYRVLDSLNTELGGGCTVALLLERGAVALYAHRGSLPDTLCTFSADSSLMRLASISKVFTALLVLDLEQEGLVDLDRDVNDYFDPPILPDLFSEPVTLRHLLTHSAGFDDRYIGKAVLSREQLPSLEDGLRRLMPQRILPPGEVFSYSNFSVALAGLTAEKVTGIPFSKLIKERVFRPLGMDQADFDPPLSAQQRILRGVSSDGLETVPMDWMLDAPAGQMLATAWDIAAFLNFALSRFPDSMTQDAVTRDSSGYGLERSRLKMALKSAEAARFTHHPALQGDIGFTLRRFQIGGVRAYGHDGGYAGCNTRLLYVPELQGGLFIFSDRLNGRLIEEFTARLSQQLFKNASAEPGMPGNSAQADSSEGVLTPRLAALPELPLSAFSGIYRNTRYARKDISKVGVLMGMAGSEMRIGLDGDYLSMPDHLGRTRRLQRIGPLLFSSVDDSYLMAFRQDGDKISHVYTSGTDAMEKSSLLFSIRFQRIFLSSAFSIFTLIFWIYLALWLYHRLKNRGRHFSLVEKSPVLHSRERLIWSVSTLYSLHPLLILLGLMSVPAWTTDIGFAHGLPAAVKISFLLPPIAAGLSVWLLLSCLLSSAQKSARLKGILFSLLSGAYSLSLWYWNIWG